MKIPLIILGGGITGRMVQYLKGGVIFESKLTLTEKQVSQNFGTNYLWKPIDGFTTKAMRVVTRIDDALPTDDSIRRYKNKIGKGSEPENEWGLQFQPESIGYFIEKYPSDNLLIKYGYRVIEINLKNKWLKVDDMESKQVLTFTYDTLISTLPLNQFVALTESSIKFPLQTAFQCRPVYVRIQQTPIESLRSQDEVYVNYISNPLVQPYRYCDRFGERHYESLTPIGFPHKRLYPGKIWKCNLTEPILNNLAAFDVFCFGRYGRWNPNELLHETYEEIRKWKN
jgi:hypothetical protein